MKLLGIFLLSLQSAFALTANDANTELKNQNWTRNDQLKLRKFGQTSDLQIFQKEIQTEGFGKKLLVSVINAESGRIWFGPACKLIYIGESKMRGVGYFSLTGSLHLIGRDFSLKEEVKEAGDLPAMIELIESSFRKNPYIWTTSCLAPNHFAQIKNAPDKRVEEIEEKNGVLTMTLNAEGVDPVVIPLAFDHVDDQCATTAELNNARTSEQPYPGGYFGWKRGLPAGEFDFDFDEKLNAKLDALLELNR